MKNSISHATLALAALLGGCATHIQSEDGLHTAIKYGVTAFDDPFIILSEIQQDASRLCEKTRQFVVTVNSEAIKGIPGVAHARARLHFRCVSP